MGALFLIFAVIALGFTLAGLAAKLPWIADADDARRRNQARPWR